jgi:hypothetical protein
VTGSVIHTRRSAARGPDLRWVPVGLAVMAEGAWIAVVAGLVQDYALRPPVLPLGGAVALVGIGAAVARWLGPRAGPRWPALGTVLVVGSGGLGLVAPALVGGRVGTDPGAVLAGLALLRGFGLARVPADDGRLARLFVGGVVTLSIAATVGGPIVAPFGTRFLADARTAVPVFAVSSLAALSLARLEAVGGGVATAWVGNRVWLATFAALTLMALVAAALWGGGLGAAIELGAGLAAGPLLILGLFAGFDRRTGRLLLATVGLAAIAIVVLPLLGVGAEESTAPAVAPGGATDPGAAASRPILIVGGGVVLVVVFAAVVVLVRAAMRQAVADDPAGLDTRSIDHGPAGAARPRRSRSGRTLPKDAVAAYVALDAELRTRAAVARLPGETPTEHAHRLRGEGSGALGLDLLAADYAIARDAGRTLTPAAPQRRSWRQTVRPGQRPIRTSRSTPAASMSFRRSVAPRRSTRSDRGTPSSRARSARSAALAAPSAAGALTRTRRTPSTTPSIASRPPCGVSRTSKRTAATR